MAVHLYRIQRGFTLVELLIVVIILAILAAIVVPQFASSTDDAKVSSLDTTLSNVRAAVDLYYQQHGEYPAANAAGPAPLCATSTDGTGAAFSNTAFLEQLSMYTDADGLACSGKDHVSFKYGPYLKKATLPKNPITDSSALVVVPDASDGDLNMTGNATAAGWKFDSNTGKFIADDHQNQDSDLQFYDTH
jgi:type II secretion system protein G